MAKTLQQAGPNSVAVYIADGMGRRIVIATRVTDSSILQYPVILARTQSEMREVIATLRDLMGELPP